MNMEYLLSIDAARPDACQSEPFCASCQVESLSHSVLSSLEPRMTVRIAADSSSKLDAQR